MPDMSALSQRDVDQFARDGVVCLKNVFEGHWLKNLERGVARDMANPSPRFMRHTPADAPAHYYEDYWVWREVPEFEDFLRSSSVGAIAGRLLRTDQVNLVMDNWFLREAGSSGRPPWHHDVSYFDFDGPMCVLWLPLQPVVKEECLTWVRGSHVWNRFFMRSFFDGRGAVDAPMTVNGVTYEETPDIDAAPEDYDLVSFEMDAGDCVFFDIRTLHGSPKSVTTERDVSRFTVRLAGAGSRIRYRGAWAQAERALFEAAGHGDGDLMDSDFFPRLWERESASERR